MKPCEPPLVDIGALVAILERLRDPVDGCAWDREQSFASIAPYTIEEAYEVADAIARNDVDELREELGDLLLQVVFHARMAEEAGLFDIAAVIETICNKMTRRHPHVFGDGAPAPGWETIKADERAGRGATGALDGVALALPALLRAAKLQRRAASTGFDWPDDTGPRAKLLEELDELADARGDADALEDEAGDLLFAAVNVVRHAGVDAETALRRANAKFERRFRAMEAEAGPGFAALPAHRKDALWEAANGAAYSQPLFRKRTYSVVQIDAMTLNTMKYPYL